jgi:hypothetical protein
LWCLLPRYESINCGMPFLFVLFFNSHILRTQRWSSDH